jgi:hypothetical protein
MIERTVKRTLVIALSLIVTLVVIIPAAAQDDLSVYWVEPTSNTMLMATVFENDTEQEAEWLFGTMNTLNYEGLPTVESARYITEELARDFPDHGADDLIVVELTHDDPSATIEINLAARHGTTLTLIMQFGVDPEREDLMEYARAVFSDGIEAEPPAGYRLLYGDGVDPTSTMRLSISIHVSTEDT